MAVQQQLDGTNSAGMRRYTSYLTIMGRVRDIRLDDAAFRLRTRGGDEFDVHVSSTTFFWTLKNLDGLDLDRMPEPPGFDASSPADLVRKYVRDGVLLAVQGTYQAYENQPQRLDAEVVHLVVDADGAYLHEGTHWWITQIHALADMWLDSLFGDRRTYEDDDFAALYRTNLNIIGLPTDDNIQECATLSRLIYGLSSAYLLTGSDRYLLAARAGVAYQRQTFRSLSHDGHHCFWAFGLRKGRYGTRLVIPSENPDDAGTMPLYEQIYALAGMTQYYRITGDRDVLDDIRRTVQTFEDLYHDPSPDGGYFSHLDYATMTHDSAALGPNRSRKNWNSVGDHLPAYLLNLLLALHPLPKGEDEELADFVRMCRRMLEETSHLILTHFPDPASPYVNERFLADWTPDHNWGWQQNRAIVGHNLKIAWNLTRVAHWYETEAASPDIDPAEAGRLRSRAQEFLALAARIGATMVENGIDLLRSGIFDAVERDHIAGTPLHFPWGNHKDFWQQEQAILAYLILHGASGDTEPLELSRELAAFYNLFFLDHDNRGIFFRVTDNGMPVIDGNMANKGGHSISGYHVFELAYLGHLYTRALVRGRTPGDGNFSLHYRPMRSSGRRSINVQPDFFRPGTLRVCGVTINGVHRGVGDIRGFQIELTSDELDTEVVVEFTPVATATDSNGTAAGVTTTAAVGA